MGFFSKIGDAISGSLGGIVGGVGQLAGGLFGSKASKDNNAQNVAFAREQLEYQKELAKNQIQWRVDDAKKAGLHPMAALGLQSTSFSPVSLSTTPTDYSFIGQAASDMGQSLNYASMKGKDRQQQAQAVQLAQEGVLLQNEGQQLQNESIRLDNEFKQWQMMTAMSGATRQALRSPAAASIDKKNSVIEGQVDAPINKYGWVSDANGRLTLGPSSDYNQLYEDKFLLEWMPNAEAAAKDWSSRLTGGPVDNRVWDSDNQTYRRINPSRDRNLAPEVVGIDSFLKGLSHRFGGSYESWRRKFLKQIDLANKRSAQYYR